MYGSIDKFKGAIKGFIWYQGESDAEDGEAGGKARALRYRTNLQTLIDSVRLRSGKPQLPCLIVQIGSLYPAGAIPVRGGQYELARTDPFIATIPVYDLGADLHLNAARQDTAGQRLGYACLRKIFGLTQYFYGPQFRDAWFLDAQKKKIVVRFSDVKTSLSGFAKDPNRYGFFVMDTAVWYRNDSTLNFSYTPPAGMLVPYDSVTLLTPEKLCIHLKSAPTAPVTMSYGRASGPSIMGFDFVTDATEIPMATTFNCPVLATEPPTSSARGVFGLRALPCSARRVVLGINTRIADRAGAAYSIGGRRMIPGEPRHLRFWVYFIPSPEVGE